MRTKRRALYPEQLPVKQCAVLCRGSMRLMRIRCVVAQARESTPVVLLVDYALR